MFSKRTFRLGIGSFRHIRLGNEIGDMGYPSSGGYCHGGALLRIYSRLTGKWDLYQKWFEILPKTSKLGVHFKNVMQKRAKGEALSREEQTFLKQFPDDLRMFLDKLVLLQDPTLSTFRPFLLNIVKSQRDVIGTLRAVEGDHQPVVQLFDDVQILNQNELQDYLAGIMAILRTVIPQEQKESCDILLSSMNHTITLTPNKYLDKVELFDMNQLPLFDIKSSDLGVEVRQALLVEGNPSNFVEGSKAFLKAFYSKKYTAFSIQILTHEKNPYIQELILRLNQFKSQRPFTDEIAQRKTPFGTSLAHLAAQIGLVDLMNMLVQLGADLEQTQGNGWRPIHFAAANGNIEMMKILLKLKVNPIAITKSESTPLMIAAENGHLEVTQLLLEKYKEIGLDYINAKNRNHYTALCFAVMEGWTDIVRLLLTNGANPTIANKYQMTPLMFACARGYSEIVELIAKTFSSVDRAANLNVVDDKGFAAVHYAAMFAPGQVIQILAQFGADLNQRVMTTSPLSLAISKHNLQAARVLVENKVVINEAVPGVTCH